MGENHFHMRPTDIHNELRGLEEGDTIARIKTERSEYEDIKVIEMDHDSDGVHRTTLIVTDQFTIKIPQDREGGTLYVKATDDSGTWTVTDVDL